MCVQSIDLINNLLAYNKKSGLIIYKIFISMCQFIRFFMQVEELSKTSIVLVPLEYIPTIPPLTTKVLVNVVIYVITCHLSRKTMMYGRMRRSSWNINVNGQYHIYPQAGFDPP